MICDALCAKVVVNAKDSVPCASGKASNSSLPSENVTKIAAQNHLRVYVTKKVRIVITFYAV